MEYGKAENESKTKWELNEMATKRANSLHRYLPLQMIEFIVLFIYIWHGVVSLFSVQPKCLTVCPELV